jgi:hypothetical protein
MALFAIRLKSIALRMRLTRVPVVTVAALRSGAPIRLRGVVSQPAAAQSPVTGEPIVAERVTITRFDGDGDLAPVEDFVVGQGFVLQDSTGSVSVVLSGAELAVPVTYAFQQGYPRVVGEGPNRPITEPLWAWVASRGHHIDATDLRVVVRSIRSGDELVTSGSVSDGVLVAGPGRPLLVVSPRALEGRWDVWAIALLTAAMLATLLAAAALAVVAAVSA